MRPNLLAAGLVALAMAIAMPANAYHITQDLVNNGNGLDAQEWSGPAGGFTACERQTPPPLSSSGVGGLCFMNPGFAGAPCAFVGNAANQGNSDGFYDPYNGGACRPAAAPQPTIAVVARQWYELRMQTAHPAAHALANTPFFAQIGPFTCAAAGPRLIYDEQFAYTMDNGHVAGFPTLAPVVGTFGGYSIIASAGPTPAMAACTPPAPMFF